MSARKHAITRADLLSMERYAETRQAERARLAKIKRHRRLDVGPFASFYFENYDTMWWQIHEMLHIEKGGEAQIADELAAYNPLIPNGAELVATLMLEIEDPVRRPRILAELGGIEHAATLSFADETIAALAEEDAERSTPGGRTSAVHFLHFPFTESQRALFREAGTQVVLGVSHEKYAHGAVMPEAVRQALCEDFD